MSIDRSTTTVRGFISRSISRVTSTGARWACTATAPSTRSAKPSAFSMFGCVASMVVTPCGSRSRGLAQVGDAHVEQRHVRAEPERRARRGPPQHTRAQHHEVRRRRARARRRAGSPCLRSRSAAARCPAPPPASPRSRTSTFAPEPGRASSSIASMPTAVTLLSASARNSSGRAAGRPQKPKTTWPRASGRTPADRARTPRPRARRGRTPRGGCRRSGRRPPRSPASGARRRGRRPSPPRRGGPAAPASARPRGERHAVLPGPRLFRNPDVHRLAARAPASSLAAGCAAPRGCGSSLRHSSHDTSVVAHGAPSACISAQPGAATKSHSSPTSVVMRSRSRLGGISRSASSSFCSSGLRTTGLRSAHASPFPACAACCTPRANASSLSGMSAHLSESAWRIAARNVSFGKSRVAS